MTLRVGHPSKKGATDTSDACLDFRNKYVCNADGSPRGGVTSPIGVNLLSSTATMNVSVAAFSAVTVRDGGVVEMANDGPTNVLLDAPPSSQSRIDVVYVKQNDSSSTVSSPDANDQAVFGVLKGVTSATPAKRTDLPAGAEEIGTVLIPSTATATNSPGVVISTTCRFTAAAGGKVMFRTLADLQGWTTAAPQQFAGIIGDPTPGLYWSGAVWRRINSGNNLVIPTSATGATINADGSVSFTAVSSFAVDGAFVAGGPFDHYVIELDQTTTTGNTNLQYVERSGGVDATTAYFWDIVFSASNAVAAANTANTSSIQLTAQLALYRHITVKVLNPAVAAIRTMVIADDASTDTSSMGQSRATGWHGTAAAYDGFKILTTVGAITGKLRIYGISNG